MRIGILCLASLGGSARIATELAVELARRGHRVHLFAQTTPFDHKLDASEVTLHTIAPERKADVHPATLYTDWSANEFQTLLSRILEVITLEGLDVLHFHYAVPFAFLATEVKRYLNGTTPVLVGTLHGTDVSIYGRVPTVAPQLTQALHGMDKLTTVSTSHARLAAELFELSTQPEVIPNFIDLTKFHPQVSPLPPFPEGLGLNRPRKPRIVHLSNFRPVKDTPSMARIFLGIRQQMEAELWLIGEGPELDTVKSILQESGYEHDLVCWGLHHNVAPLLAQTDLLLMTSLSESFCLAALEAMACGVPVLATKVGGLPEVVSHGQTGYLFPAGDHEAAIQAAVRLLSNPGQHQAMRAMAATHAARFDQQQIVSVYEGLYHKLLQRRSGNISWLPAGAQVDTN
jgi:N-acetyl-alpha-D-glucosaminyl L-malate synthase BshA